MFSINNQIANIFDFCPGQRGSVGLASHHMAKGYPLDSQLGHVPGLQVQSLVRVHERGTQWMLFSPVPSFPLSLKTK